MAALPSLVAIMLRLTRITKSAQEPILDLAHFDRRPVLLVVVLDGRGIGRAAIDRELLRHAVAAHGLLQKP